MSRLRSSRRFAAAVVAGALLFGDRALVAPDLTVIRAAAKQRSSLFRTLDVKFRVWEDLEYRMLPEEAGPATDEEMHVHWATDRGRVFLETSQRGHVYGVYYDGSRTVELEPKPPDASRLRSAYIRPGPPRMELIQRVILADALGVTELMGFGEIETALSTTGAHVDQGWGFADGEFDVAVVVPVQVSNKHTAHLGFKRDPGWMLALRHFEGPHGDVAAWVVDEWMTVTSSLTGEALSVPSRGRYLIYGVVNGKEYRQAIVFEVDSFALPARISDAEFVATIPPGTEVWEQPRIPGRPMERSIAGGTAAIEAQAAAAARKAEAAMLELQASGVKFSGRPRARNWVWVFIVVGVVLLSAVMLRRWLPGRRSEP